MQHNKTILDKKLQELERLAVPNLSRMEEHWDKVKSQLSATPARHNPSRRWFRLSLALLSLAALVFLIYIFVSPAENRNKQVTMPSTSLSPDTVPQPTMPKPAINRLSDAGDTGKNDRLFLKARTSDGKDVDLPYTLAGSSTTASSPAADLDRFFAALAPPSSYFLIDNKRDTVLHGPQGTILHINAGSFTANGPMKIELKECYNYSDMILQRLSTSSNGRQLISGGMIYVNASQDNQSLSLKKGAGIQVEMPGRAGQQPMQLFYGERISLSDSIGGPSLLNWKAVDQSFQPIKTSHKMLRVTNRRVAQPPPQAFTLINKAPGKDSAAITLPLDTIPRYDNTLELGDVDSVIEATQGIGISELGWINCDRFSNKQPLVDLTVMLPEAATYYTILVFDNFKSIMPGTILGNQVRFAGVPKDEPAKIISVGLRNGKTVSAIQPLLISRSTIDSLPFKETNPAAFRENIQSLDR